MNVDTELLYCIKNKCRNINRLKLKGGRWSSSMCYTLDWNSNGIKQPKMLYAMKFLFEKFIKMYSDTNVWKLAIFPPKKSRSIIFTD